MAGAWFCAERLLFLAVHFLCISRFALAQTGTLCQTSTQVALQGRAALNITLLSQNGDDVAIAVPPLPFPLNILGQDLSSSIFVGTNTYLTFGGNSTVFSNLGYSNPPHPTFFVGSADNSAQYVGAGLVELNGVTGLRVRLEGVSGNMNTGNTSIEVEWTFYPDNRMQLVIGRHNRAFSVRSVWGLTDGTSSFLAPMPAPTSKYQYTSFILRSDQQGSAGSWVLEQGSWGLCEQGAQPPAAPPPQPPPAGARTCLSSDMEMPKGREGLMTLFEGRASDDAGLLPPLPFPLTVSGEDVSDAIWLSTNTYLTLGAWSGLSQDFQTLSLPALLLGAAHNSLLYVGAAVEMRDGVQTMRVRLEGSDSMAADAASDIEVEVTFFPNNTILVVVGENAPAAAGMAAAATTHLGSNGYIPFPGDSTSFHHTSLVVYADDDGEGGMDSWKVVPGSVQTSSCQAEETPAPAPPPSPPPPADGLCASPAYRSPRGPGNLPEIAMNMTDDNGMLQLPALPFPVMFNGSDYSNGSIYIGSDVSLHAASEQEAASLDLYLGSMSSNSVQQVFAGEEMLEGQSAYRIVIQGTANPEPIDNITSIIQVEVTFFPANRIEVVIGRHGASFMSSAVWGLGSGADELMDAADGAVLFAAFPLVPYQQYQHTSFRLHSDSAGSVGSWMIHPGSYVNCSSVSAGPVPSPPLPFRSTYSGSCLLQSQAQVAPKGRQGLTTLYDDSMDDGAGLLPPVPFPWRILGADFSDSVFVSSNMYLTFGAWSIDWNLLGTFNPSVPALFLGAADNSLQYVGYGYESLQDAPGMRVRLEGTDFSTPFEESPTIEVELTFYPSNHLLIVTGAHARSQDPSALWRFSDGLTSYLDLDTRQATNYDNASWVLSSDPYGSRGSWAMQSGSLMSCNPPVPPSPPTYAPPQPPPSPPDAPPPLPDMGYPSPFLMPPPVPAPPPSDLPNPPPTQSPPPTAPSPPPLPPPVVYVRNTFTLANTNAALAVTDIFKLKNAFARFAGLPADAVSIENLRPAARRRQLLQDSSSGLMVDVAFGEPSQADADRLSDRLRSPDASASVQDAIRQEGLQGVTVAGVSNVRTESATPETRVVKKTTNTGAIVGGVVGGIGGALVLGAVIACLVLRRRPATATPAERGDPGGTYRVDQGIAGGGHGHSAKDAPLASGKPELTPEMGHTLPAAASKATAAPAAITASTAHTQIPAVPSQAASLAVDMPASASAPAATPLPATAMTMPATTAAPTMHVPPTPAPDMVKPALMPTSATAQPASPSRSASRRLAEAAEAQAGSSPPSLTGARPAAAPQGMAGSVPAAPAATAGTADASSVSRPESLDMPFRHPPALVVPE